MMRKAALIFIASLLLMNSCGLVFTGTKDKIKVKEGFPAAADVYYNGSYVGTAPTNVKIPKSALKNGGASITIKADGYEDQVITFGRKVRVGALVLDILTGGIWLIGDFLTHGIYKGSPNKVVYKLVPKD